MLQQAKSKNIYDDLIHSELTTFLQSNHAHYDLIVATDVLIYLGDLEDTFLNIKKALKPSAHFCFTVEESESDNFYLESTARFSHSMNYCLELSKKYGFTVLSIKKDILRFQDGIPVNGLFFCIGHS
jgi:predicted TPR repeat methyltransferase